jgi:hypothetical protein
VNVSLATRKRLWSNGGRLCAYSGCGQRLFVPVEGDTEEVVVGKECHIVARGSTGARAPDSLTEDEQARWRSLIDDRNGYQNLILLCGTHHDIIDTDVANHSVARLVEMKQAHEATIEERLSPKRRNENIIEIRYAAIVDQWARRIDIDRWDGQISRAAVSGAVRENTLDELRSLGDWLLKRVWPRTLPQLENAFLNFRTVAEDFDAVVTRFATHRGGNVLIDRVYREVDGMRADPDTRRFLERRSEYYQDLAADLAVELTRAVNLVSERVREQLWPTYRLNEGYATIGLGLNAGLVFETLRPLYAPNAPDVPYPGLGAFVTERAQRDYARGVGAPPDGAGLPGISRMQEGEDE